MPRKNQEMWKRETSGIPIAVGWRKELKSRADEPPKYFLRKYPDDVYIITELLGPDIKEFTGENAKDEALKYLDSISDMHVYGKRKDMGGDDV